MATKKIAVMLPHGYRGGSLRVSKNIAKALAYQARQRQEDLQVVFSYEEGTYDLSADFGDLEEYGIELRGTRWVKYHRTALQWAIKLIGSDPQLLQYSEYCLPVDGANDFYDCDLWVVISDRLPAPLLPLRRYVCFIYDYIQRYDPGLFGRDEAFWSSQVTNQIGLARNAARIFVSTPSTRGDLISYAGVDKARVHLLEMDFEPIVPKGSSLPGRALPEEYFLWATNTSHHKNHTSALDALERYVQDLGGNLSVAVTGVNTEYFDPDNEFEQPDAVLSADQVQYVRNKLARNPALKERVCILGNVSTGSYALALQNARFLWHPGLFDNGTFSAIEAAYLGVPTLSARYPAQEYINQRFGLNMHFFDPHNSMQMADALLAMEEDAADIPLPTQAHLLRHDWKSHSAALYGNLIELIW